MTVKNYDNFKQSFGSFDWYGHQGLVWPIVVLANNLSANQKRALSFRSDAEAGFKDQGTGFGAFALWFRAQRLQF